MSLGSTIITRFLATTDTLTPAVARVSRVSVPDRSPWLLNMHFWTFRLQPPHAPLFRPCFLLRAGLTPDSLCVAIGGSSDFALCSQSRQSHKAVSSSFRGFTTNPSVLRTIRSLPVALHPVSPRRSYFPLLAFSSAREGLPPSHARSISSARARASSPNATRIFRSFVGVFCGPGHVTPPKEGTIPGGGVEPEARWDGVCDGVEAGIGQSRPALPTQPAKASALVRAEIAQPVFQASAGGRKGQGQGRDAFLQRGAKHGGANQVVGQQAGQPFLARHLSRMGLQLRRIHLGFDVAQIQFDVPSHPIEPDQFGLRIQDGILQRGEQAQPLGPKTRTLEPHDNDPSLNRLPAQSGWSLSWRVGVQWTAWSAQRRACPSSLTARISVRRSKTCCWLGARPAPPGRPRSCGLR